MYAVQIKPVKNGDAKASTKIRVVLALISVSASLLLIPAAYIRIFWPEPAHARPPRPEPVQISKFAGDYEGTCQSSFAGNVRVTAIVDTDGMLRGKFLDSEGKVIDGFQGHISAEGRVSFQHDDPQTRYTGDGLVHLEPDGDVRGELGHRMNGVFLATLTINLHKASPR